MFPARWVLEVDLCWFFLTLCANAHMMRDFWFGLKVSRDVSWMWHCWRNDWNKMKLRLCLVIVEVVTALLEALIASLTQSKK